MEAVPQINMLQSLNLDAGEASFLFGLVGSRSACISTFFIAFLLLCKCSEKSLAVLELL
jgi:hypothetical protein